MPSFELLTFRGAHRCARQRGRSVAGVQEGCVCLASKITQMFDWNGALLAKALSDLSSLEAPYAQSLPTPKTLNFGVVNPPGPE